MSRKIDLNFGWGDPYFLMDLLDTMYVQRLSPFDIKNMCYSTEIGDPELIIMVKKIIKKTTNIDYKHIVITNGATQAINVLMRVLKRKGIEEVVTGLFGYPYYGDMIKKAGLTRIKGFNNNNDGLTRIKIVDSPSNPEGLQYGSGIDSKKYKIIWDAVYHNSIYTSDLKTIPTHDYHVGSFSKLLGLTGARIGYIALNNDFQYQSIIEENLKETATVSVPSQRLIIDVLNKINLDHFMKIGKIHLDLNREEMSKIEYLFDNQRVQETGMFYCAYADKKALDLLKRCSIKYVNLGNNYIRLNLGQRLSTTKHFIKTIKKRDRI